MADTSRQVEKVLKLIKVQSGNLGTSFLIKSCIDDVFLGLLQRHNAVLYRPPCMETVDFDGLLLAYTMGAVDSLHFNIRVPERLDDDDTRRRDEVEAGIARSQREEHDFDVRVVAKALRYLVTRSHGHATIISHGLQVPHSLVTVLTERHFQAVQ